MKLQKPALSLLSQGGTLKIPTSTSSNPEGDARKKRKRLANREFYDVNDAISLSSGLALVGATAVATAAPQELVLIWAIGNAGIMIPSNAVAAGTLWMIPSTATPVVGPSNQPQLWTISPSVRETNQRSENINQKTSLSWFNSWRELERQCSRPLGYMYGYDHSFPRL